LRSSLSAGSAGFSGLVTGLRQEWRRALLRFAIFLVGASLAWFVVAPAYAAGLGVAARLLLPSLEQTPGTRYAVEGSRVLAYRPVWLSSENRTRDRVYTLWTASASFGMPVFVALVLASPGWSGRRRARGLAWGLVVLALTQVLTIVVTNEFWQQSPVPTPDGHVFYFPGHSLLRWRVASALYNFVEIMSRGFFALLVYFALVVQIETPRARRSTRPNERCPCGSGRKFKRCCGLAR
jgi:SEC-C motif